MLLPNARVVPSPLILTLFTPVDMNSIVEPLCDHVVDAYVKTFPIEFPDTGSTRTTKVAPSAERSREISSGLETDGIMSDPSWDQELSEKPYTLTLAPLESIYPNAITFPSLELLTNLFESVAIEDAVLKLIMSPRFVHPFVAVTSSVDCNRLTTASYEPVVARTP